MGDLVSVRSSLFVLLALTVLLVPPLIQAQPVDAASAEALYSKAVGEYVEENYAQSYRHLKKLLDENPEHPSARDLLDQVEGELGEDRLRDLRNELTSPSGSAESTDGETTVDRPEADDPGQTAGTPDDTGTEPSDTATDFDPLPTEDRRESSPTPPELSGEPSETVEHVNEDYDVPDDARAAVHGLVAERYSDRVRLRIRTSRSVGFVGSRIFNPPMIIVDLPQSVDRLPDSPLPLELNRIVRARHSQYRTDPVRTTRVVFDLRKWNDRYRVYRSADGTEVVVDVFEDDADLPPETPMVQRMDEISAPDRVSGASGSLEKVSGDRQSLDVRSEAPEELSLRLTDHAGDPLAGETVVYSVEQGGGAIGVGSDTMGQYAMGRTDGGGFVRANFRADTRAGLTVVKARVPERGIETKYRLRVNPGSPAELVPVSGNRQSTLYGRSVTNPLVVEARDRYGNPVPGVDLKVKDDSGKGMIDLSSDTRGIQVRGKTDRSGRLTVDFYRTAPDVDRNEVRVSTYQEDNPELSTTFLVFGQPQLISIDFKDANLQDVLRTLAQLANWNIALAEETDGDAISEMSVTVHLENVTALRALDTILDVKGLSRVSDGNVMKIVSKSAAIKKGVSVLSPEELDDYPANNVVTVAYKLRYLQATSDLASQLQETLLAENSSIVAEQTSNSLVVTDLANNLRRLRRIINDIDRQDQLFEVRTFDLDRRDPEKLSSSIDELLPTGQGNIVPHRATNTLLVYADPSLMDRVTRLVESLDDNNALAENLEVLDVEGFDAESIAQRINSILGVQVLDVSQLETLDFEFESAEELQQFFSSTQEVELGTLINSAKVIALPQMDKIIVFGPKDLRETARQLVDELKRKPGEYIANREFQWITIHSLPLEKARQLINRFGGVRIQAGLKARRAFLVSSENADSLKKIKGLMKKVDQDVDLESNRDVVVYQPQYVDAEELGSQIDEYLQNLVSEGDQQEGSAFAQLFGLDTGDDQDRTRVVHSDANLLVMAVSRWEADFVRNLLEKLDRETTKNQTGITYFPRQSDPNQMITSLQENNIGRVLYQDDNKFTLLVDKNRVEEIKELIRTIDSEGLETYSYSLEYSPADQETLDQLRNIVENVGLQATFTGDASSNKIFFNTPSANREDVRSLIEAFDSPGTSENRDVMNFSPSYVDPSTLRQSIEERNLGTVILATDNKVSLLVPAERKKRIREIIEKIDDPSQTFNIVKLEKRKASQEFVDNIEPVLDSLGLNVALTAEPKTNSIVYAAPASSADRVEQMLRRLDDWQKQVLIKAVLMEVELGESEQVNPEWILNPSSNNLLTGSARIEGGESGMSFNVGGGGEFSALLDAGDFQKVFRWLRSNSRTDVVTRPSVTALNNQEAELDLSQQRFYQQTTTDLESNVQETEFVEQTAQRTMTVQPTVTEGDNVILDVSITNDVFGAQPGAGAPFPINTRSTQNQILVHDRQTLALGGIIQSNQSREVSKVPFLSSLPLVGNAFRSEIISDDRTELLVFITPHVLSTPEDLQKASRETLEDMENIETPGEIKDADRADTEPEGPQFQIRDREDTDGEGTDESQGLSVDETVLEAPGAQPNINRVGRERLREAVGEGFASRLLEERDQNGYYTGMSDLRNRLNLTGSEADKIGEVFTVAVPVVNLNEATEQQLARLPDVTPDLASNIVNHRFTQGEFRSVRGLYQVFGMTEEKFKTLKPYLTVD